MEDDCLETTNALLVPHCSFSLFPPSHTTITLSPSFSHSLPPSFPSSFPSLPSLCASSHQLMFWSELTFKGRVIKKAFLNGSNIAAVIDTGLRDPRKLSARPYPRLHVHIYVWGCFFVSTELTATSLLSVITAILKTNYVGTLL